MKRLTCLTVILVTALLAAPRALADWDVSWYTIDGGGGISEGGAYTISGTIGQADVGAMAGGSFELAGGFWTQGDTEPNCPVPADFNCDGSVNVADMLILLGSWGECDKPCPADLDGNGTVAVSDLLILLAAWG